MYVNKELLEDDTFIPKNMLEGIFSWRLFREVHKGDLLFRAFSNLFYLILKMIKENLTKITADPEKQEIIITREFDAQREFVWKALTYPERVKRLWGPKGFASPVAKIDFCDGGTSLVCMRSPEGKDYWSTGIYREIVEPERIVSTDSFSDAEGNVVPASYNGMSRDWPLELY